MFADVKGSTALASELGEESWHEVLDGLFRILSHCVHARDGTVNQYTGDGIMAIFGAPVAHEDHAQRACHAALEIQRSLVDFVAQTRRRHGVRVAVRIGINSGQVVVGSIGDDLRRDYTAQGYAVAVAQRLEQAAPPGGVYVSASTNMLVRDYFELRHRGEQEVTAGHAVEPCFELLRPTDVASRLDAARTRGFTDFVGRSRELSALHDALAATRAGRGHVVGLMGEPGVGKSRLSLRFLDDCRQQGLRVYHAHCPAHGHSIPFVPFRDFYRQYFEITPEQAPEELRSELHDRLTSLGVEPETTLPALLDLLGIPGSSDTGQMLDADARQRQLIGLLEVVVRRSGTQDSDVSVIWFDDLHWIDAWSDEYLAALVDLIAGTHMMIVATFRPEYLADWTQSDHYRSLEIEPLDGQDLARLVTSLLGDHPSVDSLKEKVWSWCRGNPLFAEEATRMLEDAGHLSGRRGDYRLLDTVDSIAIPDTVQALIASRIDQLSDTDKEVLYDTAVIGTDAFPELLESVCSLVPSTLAASLERLADRDLLRKPAAAAGHYAFNHPLVQEIAYRSQLRGARAARHRRVALALEELAADNLRDATPALAYHWDHANDAAQALHWQREAALISQVNDPHAGLAHWRRVRELVEELKDSLDVLQFGAEACERLITMEWRMGGNEEEARRHFEDGRAMASTVGDDVLLAALTGSYSAYRGPTVGDANDYASYAERAHSLARRTGDQDLVDAMVTWRVSGYFFSARYREGLNLLNSDLPPQPSDLEAAKRFVSAPARGIVQMVCGMCAGYLGDLDGALELIREGLPQAEQLPDAGSFGYSFESFFLGCRGDDSAIEASNAAVQFAEQSGSNYAIAAALSVAGALNYLLQRPARAEQLLRRCLEHMETSRSGGSQRSIVIGNLANIELDKGHASMAEAMSRACMDFCRPKGLLWSLEPWFANSRACIVLGRPESALSAIREAEAIIGRSDARLLAPLLRLQKAAFADRFDSPWNAAAERESARIGFTAMGADRLAERLLGRH